MVHINEKFKVIDKDKKIIGSILIPFFVINVILLIVTSGYSVDISISVFFRKGMANNFVRGVGAFSIADGYNALVSYTVPLGMLILESLYVYIKGRKTKLPKALYKTVFIVIYLAVFATFEYFTITSINHFMMQDRDNGFNLPGQHFVFWFLIDGGEYYSIYLVSIIINNVICIGLLSYIHFCLAKRKDFIESKYGLKAIQGLVLVGFLYVMYEQLSKTMQRPHPYRVKGHDFLDEMQTINGGKYAHYYDQYTGFGFDKSGPYPGKWFNGGGEKNVGDTDEIFLSNKKDLNFNDVPGGGAGGMNASKYRDHFAGDSDFPSGHMNELCIALNAVMIIFGGKKQTKKQRRVKMALFGVIMLGGLDMIFSMLVMQGHGLSDMAFSFVGALPAYFLSGLVTYAIFQWLPRSKGFKDFSFEEGSMVVSFLMAFIVVFTSGVMVGEKGGSYRAKLSAIQFAGSVVALLIVSFSLVASILENELKIWSIFNLFEIIVFAFTCVIGAVISFGPVNSVVYIFECISLGLSFISLAYEFTKLTLKIVNKNDEQKLIRRNKLGSDCTK